MNYEKTFKEKAVQLAIQRGNVTEVAKELKIDRELLYRWKREYSRYDKNSFPGHGVPKLTDLERENSLLKKKLRDAQMENDILKKAIRIFSVSDGKSTSL